MRTPLPSPPRVYLAGPDVFFPEPLSIARTRKAFLAYQTAEQLLRHNRSKLVRGGRVRPRWIDGGARFWYMVGTPPERTFVLVDPMAGTRGPAFDHEKLASALAAASGHEVDAAALPFEAIELAEGAVEFDAFGAHWRCALDSYECAQVVDHQPANFLEITSPDRKHVVFLHDHDLWRPGAGHRRGASADLRRRRRPRVRREPVHASRPAAQDRTRPTSPGTGVVTGLQPRVDAPDGSAGRPADPSGGVHAGRRRRAQAADPAVAVPRG